MRGCVPNFHYRASRMYMYRDWVVRNREEFEK